MHAIPSIGTITEVKEKNQVQLELDMYFKQLMSIATSADIQMSANTMHQYVSGLTTLKTMMHMLYNEFDRGAISVYLDEIEARFFFHKDVTTKYVETITNYQAWNQFATIDHQEDVDKLVFRQLSKSQ